MERQIFHPENEDAWHALRAQDLTSTDVPALFGLSPYKTLFELWHEKRAGEVVRIEDNDRMEAGREMEPVVAKIAARRMGWSIRPMKEYIRIDHSRIGSSFDFRIQDRAPTDGPVDDILEIKCVDWLAFRDGWAIDDGFIEAPAHIEIQVQHQMLVSGLANAYIGVMVGGNDIRVIERRADEAVQRGILARAADFWQSIDNNAAPDPVMPDDAEAVIRMHAYAEPGKLYDARSDAEIASAIAEYSRIKREAADLEKLAQARKAEILSRIGDAEKVILDGYSISAGMVAPCEVSYTRSGYRNFRVVPKKQKQTAA